MDDEWLKLAKDMEDEVLMRHRVKGQGEGQFSGSTRRSGTKGCLAAYVTQFNMFCKEIACEGKTLRVKVTGAISWKRFTSWLGGKMRTESICHDN